MNKFGAFGGVHLQCWKCKADGANLTCACQVYSSNRPPIHDVVLDWREEEKEAVSWYACNTYAASYLIRCLNPLKDLGRKSRSAWDSAASSSISDPWTPNFHQHQHHYYLYTYTWSIHLCVCTVNKLDISLDVRVILQEAEHLLSHRLRPLVHRRMSCTRHYQSINLRKI